MEQNTGYTNLQPGIRPVPIVAIGGSAGGQQAISEFLNHLPGDTGLAYVYIQHLSPEYESRLAVILAAHTPMRVVEAAHAMHIEPDHLYVIPPGADMEVVDGVLVLIPRKSDSKLHRTVDQFFMSLAERQKDGAIGIVLSGMASDGTLGLKAIKVAGGITIAQDESATFQSMPQSAVSEGVVDMVLSPKEMANEVARLSKQADIFRLTGETAEQSEEMTDAEDLTKVLLFVKSSVGVDFTHYKTSTIKRRIIRRMLLYKLQTLSDYLSYMKQHPSEASTLYADLLINVTSFFRDQPVMDHLKEQILPQIFNSKTSLEPVRIWVAGCSTGQEAYSLAIIIIELFGEKAANLPIQIFATDLSDSAISKARLGLYTKTEVSDISPERLERFFSKSDDHYRVNKLVRDLCVFAPHNLLSDPPFSRMDLISCRNLLIYLDDELQKKVFSTFHYALKPDGFLLLGKSESVGSAPNYFTQIEKGQKVFVRKNNTQVKVHLDMTAKSHTMPQEHKVTTVKNPEVVSSNVLDKLVDNLLLTRYVPASVVVDQDMEIIQFRGSTTLFLQHGTGRASLNLTKMAHPSLVFELRNMIHKARKSAQPARKNALELTRDGKTSYVNIEAVPITNPANQQLFLVLFEEVSGDDFERARSSGENDSRSQLLEAELAALRQDMHSIIEEQEASNEELQSANEEIVSSNEELQSINEELETSKEEIQSANEELQTINQELQVRNDQLMESYEYSEAILSTINEATLVLDDHLRVKSANKAFYKIFSTSAEQTEERLVYELGSRQLDVPAFRDVLHDVITRDIAVQGIEVQINITPSERRTMVIHARKVVQHGKQTVLLVFEDITSHRREQALLQQRQQWFEELVDNAPAMIWVCQTDGKVNFLNKAWTDYTGQMNQDGEVTFLGAIHPSDIESYQNEFRKHFAEQKAFSFEYRLKKADGEYRWVLENAKPLFNADGTFIGYTGSSMDIHLQKTLTQQLNRHVDEKTAELKKANADLTQTAENLQAVLDSSPAAIAFFKAGQEEGSAADFQLAVCNRKFSARFDCAANELIGSVASQLLPEQRFLDMRQVYKSTKTIYREHYHEEKHQWTGLSITRHDHGVAITEMDITSLKAAHAQENELIDKLNSSYQLIESLSVMKEYVQNRGLFLRTSFHDLRGSFGLVVGAASVLDMIETKEERDKVLGIIQRNLAQVAQMMNQLLDYSRLESGEETLKIETFNAADLLKELCEGAARAAEEKGLSLHFGGTERLITDSDQVKIRRIAQNLVLNAVKYSMQGHVTVQWQPVQQDDHGAVHWELIVADSGPGLPPHLLVKLGAHTGTDSEKLPQEEAPLANSEGHGEGIGLFIVKRLCEMVGARMAVESDSETGTRFTILFPVMLRS